MPKYTPNKVTRFVKTTKSNKWEFVKNYIIIIIISQKYKQVVFFNWYIVENKCDACINIILNIQLTLIVHIYIYICI